MNLHVRLFFFNRQIAQAVMTKKQKYYVVWVGIKPGIYSVWSEAKTQIDNYPKAQYKSFESLAEAETAFKNKPAPFFGTTAKKEASGDKKNIVYESICVDAACSGNPGIMEYRCVDTRTKEQIFHQGPYKESTNNIGEFLALVHALAMLKKQGRHSLIIYTDSITAIAWVRNKKAKTTLAANRHNADWFDMIHRAETWLKENTFGNPIVKWETEIWGEIPADFGRK